MTEPPQPFDPEEFILEAGEPVYRVFSTHRGTAEFRPSGPPASSRFAFFGDPNIAVMYGAETEQAAICETLLHDVPQRGGKILPADYREKAATLLSLERPLRLASFKGTGLRRLRAKATDVTDTTSFHYPRTNRWAEAAHEGGFDGIVWMSRKCNSDRAYVFFGDRVASGDFTQDNSYGRAFDNPTDLDWLVDFCAPLHVDVIVELG